MLCNDKKSIGVAGLVLALALCLPQMLQGAEAVGGPDGAMRAFLSALKSKNTTGVLTAFSRTTHWQLVSYDITNPGRIIDRKTITYAQLARDFSHRQGWYEYLIDNYRGLEGGDTLGDTMRGMTKWHKNENTFGNASKKPSFYIKWRPEGGRWVIAEIGHTPP